MLKRLLTTIRFISMLGYLIRVLQHTSLETAPQQRNLKYFLMAICLITGGERFAYVQGFIPKKRWVEFLGLLKRRLYPTQKSSMLNEIPPSKGLNSFVYLPSVFAGVL